MKNISFALIVATLSGCASYGMPHGTPPADVALYEVCRAALRGNIGERNAADAELRRRDANCDQYANVIAATAQADAAQAQAINASVGALLLGAAVAVASQPTPQVIVIKQTTIIRK